MFSYRYAYLDIGVRHSDTIVTVSIVFGWIYFIVWSFSFYPQIWTNWRRKSVAGFSLDFGGLNVTGFALYAVFNSGLYYSRAVRSEYETRIPRSEIPVEFNDVIYSIHATFATALTVLQCLIYEVSFPLNDFRFSELFPVSLKLLPV